MSQAQPPPHAARPCSSLLPHSSRVRQVRGLRPSTPTHACCNAGECSQKAGMGLDTAPRCSRAPWLPASLPPALEVPIHLYSADGARALPLFCMPRPHGMAGLRQASRRLHSPPPMILPCWGWSGHGSCSGRVQHQARSQNRASWPPRTLLLSQAVPSPSVFAALGGSRRWQVFFSRDPEPTRWPLI